MARYEKLFLHLLEFLNDSESSVTRIMPKRLETDSSKTFLGSIKVCLSLDYFLVYKSSEYFANSALFDHTKWPGLISCISGLSTE